MKTIPGRKTKRRLKHNTKVNKIRCLRCSIENQTFRNATKFCSDLCRVQESNRRKELGFNHLEFEGTLEGLTSFLNDYNKSVKGLPYNDELDDIKDEIILKDMKYSWRKEFSDFLLYYIPGIKKKPYQLFFNEDKHAKLKLYEKINVPIAHKPQVKIPVKQ